MQITIDLPDNLELTETDLRTELAIALFQQEQITLGTASHLAGLHQIEFQRLIASRGICIHYDVDDLDQDLKGIASDEPIKLARDGWRQKHSAPLWQQVSPAEMAQKLRERTAHYAGPVGQGLPDVAFDRETIYGD